MTQEAKLNDVNTCTRCKTKNTVQIYEGQKSSPWQCSKCGLVQVWRPSKNFKLATA